METAVFLCYTDNKNLEFELFEQCVPIKEKISDDMTVNNIGIFTTVPRDSDYIDVNVAETVC